MARKKESEATEEKIPGAGLVADAPPEPRMGGATLIVGFGLIVVLWWAFHGAKFRPDRKSVV